MKIQLDTFSKLIESSRKSSCINMTPDYRKSEGSLRAGKVEERGVVSKAGEGSAFD